MTKCPKCNLEMKLSKDGKWWYCPENSRDSEHKGFLKNIQEKPALKSAGGGSSEILEAITLIRTNIEALNIKIEAIKTDMDKLLGIWKKISTADKVVLYPKELKGINPDLAGEIERDDPELKDYDPEKIPF